MKKTLIALAVLATSGASFAQVTVTGNLTMGYRSTTTGAVGASADASGLGVDTSQINFTATEDLGGGYKMTATMALAGADRSNESALTSTPVRVDAVSGRDAALALTTPVGKLTLSSAMSLDYLSGTLAGVDAYYSTWDGKVLSARSSRDVVKFAAPVGPVTLAVSYEEAGNLQGLGAGTTGTSATTGQSLSSYGVTYAQGPLNLAAAYLAYNATLGTKSKNQTRLSGNYNLGVAKVGAGLVLTNGNAAVGSNPKMTDYLLGVTVPMGAVTLGAQWVSRTYDNYGVATAAVAGDGTATGTSLQMSYALSKRTAVIANYARWTQTGGTNAGVLAGRDASSQYNVLLSHSF